jgi:hypothetical protein
LTIVPRSARNFGRHLSDAGYAALLLAMAIVWGYGLLAPATLRAKTLTPKDEALRTVSARELLDLDMSAAAPRALLDREMSPATRPLPRPWPARVTGRVLDAERQPVPGAAIVTHDREIRADAEGAFALEGLPPDTTLLVKVPGYEKVTVGPTREPIEVVLKPKVVKAAYLTYYGVADRGIRGRVLDLLAKTELNAVVIDVKGDRGWIPYRTQVPEALAAGAQGPIILKDFGTMLAELKAGGVYTIARVVTFKDNVLARARPDLAVIDNWTGQAWIDNERLAWVDPFRPEVWRYNIAIAREAALKGFDEIQFDYVRFPTDGRVGQARYSKPNTRATRLPAVAGFLEQARRELAPLGVFVAADIFGYTAFNEGDTDIGQRIEELVPHLDFICPMVYPSGYHLGIPGYRNPVMHPYQVVFESVRLIRKRAAPHLVGVRPWLQDFRDYAFDRRTFGPVEIRAQMKGADDGGAVGWMLWNPRNEYTAAALSAKGQFAAK